MSQTITALILTAITCSLWKPNTSRGLRNFLVSVGLVVLACIHAKYMVDLSSLIDLLAQTKNTTLDAAEKAKSITSIWAGVASLIVGGIGVNLLSSWIDS